MLAKVVCTRPAREIGFNISVDHYKNKTLVHCYGHGGAGWTTLFGSVEKAVRLFEKLPGKRNKPIRVIGSGCMGLTAAIELDRSGFKVNGITTKNLYDLPSWQAGGFFSSLTTKAGEQEDILQLCMSTFHTLQKIEKGSHPYISKDSVRFLPVYCRGDIPIGLDGLEEKGLLPLPEKVTLDFGTGISHPGYVKHMTYFLDTVSIMRQLTSEVKNLSIPIEIKTIHSFDEIEEEIIFNCTGLGARELNQDADVIPVRGHVVILKDNAGSAHMDYMICTKVVQDGQDEYIYMFPRPTLVSSAYPSGIACKGLLGGTFLPDVDKLSTEEQAELDRREFNKMLDRHFLFFYGSRFKFQGQETG